MFINFCVLDPSLHADPSMPTHVPSSSVPGIVSSLRGCGVTVEHLNGQLPAIFADHTNHRLVKRLVHHSRHTVGVVEDAFVDARGRVLATVRLHDGPLDPWLAAVLADPARRSTLACSLSELRVTNNATNIRSTHAVELALTTNPARREARLLGMDPATEFRQQSNQFQQRLAAALAQIREISAEDYALTTALFADKGLHGDLSEQSRAVLEGAFGIPSGSLSVGRLLDLGEQVARTTAQQVAAAKPSDAQAQGTAPATGAVASASNPAQSDDIVESLATQVLAQNNSHCSPDELSRAIEATAQMMKLSRATVACAAAKLMNTLAAQAAPAPASRARKGGPSAPPAPKRPRVGDGELLDFLNGRMLAEEEAGRTATSRL